MKYTLNKESNINYIREVGKDFTYSTAFMATMDYDKKNPEAIPKNLLEDPIMGELLSNDVPVDVWDTLYSLIFLHYSTSLHERKFVIIFHSNFYGNHFHKEITDLNKGRYLQKLLTLTSGVHIYNCTPFTKRGTYLTDYLLDYYEPSKDEVSYKVEVEGHYLEPNDKINVTNILGQHNFLEKHFHDWGFDREDLVGMGVQEIEVKLDEGLGHSLEVGSFVFLDGNRNVIPIWYLNYYKSDIDSEPKSYEEVKGIRVVIVKKLNRKRHVHLRNYAMPTLDLSLLEYFCKNGTIEITQPVR